MEKKQIEFVLPNIYAKVSDHDHKIKLKLTTFDIPKNNGLLFETKPFGHKNYFSLRQMSYFIEMLTILFSHYPQGMCENY